MHSIHFHLLISFKCNTWWISFNQLVIRDVTLLILGNFIACLHCLHSPVFLFGILDSSCKHLNTSVSIVIITKWNVMFYKWKVNFSQVNFISQNPFQWLPDNYCWRIEITERIALIQGVIPDNWWSFGLCIWRHDSVVQWQCFYMVSLNLFWV